MTANHPLRKFGTSASGLQSESGDLSSAGIPSLTQGSSLAVVAVVSVVKSLQREGSASNSPSHAPCSAMRPLGEVLQIPLVEFPELRAHLLQRNLRRSELLRWRFGRACCAWS